jgi:hypothetical protein
MNETIRIAALLVLAIAPALAPLGCGGEETEQLPAPQDRPLLDLETGMTRRVVQEHLDTVLAGWEVVATATLGNQNRVSYGTDSAVRMVVHYEGMTAIEIYDASTGDRLPRDPKETYALRAGMPADACDAEARKTPGVQRMFELDSKTKGCKDVVYANPKDALSVIVLTFRDDRLEDAHWFGTGESLLRAGSE